MNFGVWIPNCRHLATPDIIRSTAVGAEQPGYDQIAELAACGVEHLVLEFLSADGRELGEQMAVFADRVRPHLA